MNSRLCTPASTNARGLALVELIVVLLILALIAGTAITATQGMVEGRFYDTTRDTLESVDEAILGPYAPPTAHDDTLLEGFVADVGRLPRVVGTDPELALAELWTLPDGVAQFGLQPAPPGDDALRILGGWRGPYLHTGIGAARLLDGWGHAFHVLKADGTPALAGDLPGRIVSFGSNPDDGDDDIAITIERSIASENDPVVPPRHLAPLTIRLEPTVEGGLTDDVLVRVYGPDGVDGVVRAIFQHSFVNGVLSHEFPAVPVGPRVVRAYQWPSNTTPPLPNDDTPLDPRSAPVTVRLVRRGAAEVVLKVMPPSDG